MQHAKFPQCTSKQGLIHCPPLCKSRNPLRPHPLQPLGEERLVSQSEDHGRPDEEHILKASLVCCK